MFDENKKVNEKGWGINEKVSFEVNVNDTINKYDFALNLRNTTDYTKSNIIFFITTIYPDRGVTKIDTVECSLAYPDGQWVGKGSGKIKDNRFWFAKDVQFPQKGNYVFEIKQATREDSLVGIIDVGLHIENRKKSK
jgi:gliding motility-associated lipoprotein GldH